MEKNEIKQIQIKDSTIHKKITINSISNTIRYFTYLIITFLMTPFYIRTLGDSIYGLWVVLIALIGHIGILELGIQTVVIKFVSEFQASEDRRKVSETVITTLIFFLIIGLLAMGICWLISSHFLHFFVSNEENMAIARILLLILGVDFAFILQRYLFAGMLFGLQLYHIKNLLDIVSYVISTLIIYILLSKGNGILTMAIIKLVSDFLVFVSLAAVCRKVYPFSFNLSLLSKETFKKLITFAGKSFTSTTMVRLAYNADPIIISYFLSTAWVAIFSISQRLIQYIKELSWTFTSVFLPVFSELDGKKDNDAIRSIYITYTRYIVLVIFPILASVFVYGLPFIHIWIEEKYAYEGRYVLYFLLGSLFFSMLNPLVYRLFYGINRLAVVVKVPCIVCLVNIILSVLFVQKFGISGVAFATLLAFAFQEIFYLWHTSRYFHTNPIVFFRESLATPIINSLIYGLTMYSVNIFSPADSYFLIALQIVVCLPVYLLLAFFLSLNAKERDFVVNKIQSFFPLFKRKISFDI
jgi:O-antigen/teichoic acid export membrane protein